MLNFKCRIIPGVIAIVICSLHGHLCNFQVSDSSHRHSQAINGSVFWNKWLRYLKKKRSISVMTNSHTMFICSFVQKETTLCSRRKLALPPTSVHWLRVPVGQFGRLTNIFPSLCRADQSQTALTRFLRPELDYCAHNTSGIFVGSRWQDSGLRFIVVKYSVKKKKNQQKPDAGTWYWTAWNCFPPAR